VQSQIWSEGHNWGGELFIPIQSIPGNSNKLFGNICACLGRPRSYFSLNNNIENRADFHRPDLFVNLGELA
jgi:hypothetical protein